MKPSKVFAYSAVIGLFWTVMGCGTSSDAPELVQAQGVVTFQKKPLAGAQVLFTPTAGAFAMGETNEQGEFQLNTRGRQGAVIGEHRVTIVANQPMTSTVEHVADATSPEEGKPVVSRIPQKFSDLKNSPLTAKVEQTGENRFEFHLE